MRIDRSQKAITLSAQRVAQIGYSAFMRGKRVVLAGVGNKIAAFFIRLIPNALLLAAVGKRMQNRDSVP
jgi:short-subunit dehydrogenase